MVRNVLAVIAGMLVGSMVNMAILLGFTSMLWPPPPDLDMANSEQMQAFIATLPVAALLSVVVAHLGQAFVGGWVAARLSSAATRPSTPMALALIVGGLTLLGGVFNMLNIGGPAWMWIEMPLYLVVAAAAGTFELRRRG